MPEQVEFFNEHPSLNKDFFENILKRKFDTDAIVLKDFEFDPTKDEHFGIQMTRVKLYYSFCDNDNMDIVSSTFMVKTRRIGTDADAEVLGKSNVFIKEATFHVDILPELHRIMDEKMIDTVFAPRCFNADISFSSIVFEDLSKKGYKKASNCRGLDYDQLKICLQKLAKLHALSACFGVKDPLLLKIFNPPLITPDTPELFQFFEKPLRICAEASASWPGFEKISTKLFNLEATIVGKVTNLFKTSKFNVIGHGDLWSKNLMYLYDKDEKPVDVIMLDYSSGYWASPSIDLAYLLYSSSSDDVGSNELRELLDCYYQDLISNLTLLNYTGYMPTLEDMNAEISVNTAPIIAITILVNGLRLSENSENVYTLSMVGNLEGSNYLTDLMSTFSYRKRMEFLLTYYDSMGFLD